ITCAGVVVREPTSAPIWPYWLLPQHHTDPSVFAAQVCAPPAYAAATSVDIASTRVGVRRGLVSPRPSCPKRLLPQHHSELSTRSAHECCPPAYTSVTLGRSAGSMLTGEVCGTVSPVPSWPNRLSPQHHTAPSLVNAHV